ncbi:LptF/LptG family permease [Roseivirga sp. E12]|uniref:LptF/LptG family permease n=1 Tax=Roseivirga sp. E12 TaxID=2819237 RepID=UPI001ABCE795|nr:LptF/LptG family permease [Roseivirga sp. E12]MBO3697086.1 LptF/LptG family permease [Roseivirga sp. E12]
MKKIDRLVFGSFIGPFLLTLVVVDFILLLVTLLKYFDQIMGKGLSVATFGELITYFSISSSPDAFPLAILLSSIMTFGNLGEHSELTAVKSSGISLVRALLPIFFFVVLLTGFTYYSNTQLVPKTNLKTYSLLWDMRTKKPALDIKEGVFYTGIPGYSIKVNEKIGDEQLKDIIIYDHTNANAQGNTKVILADSGRMYSFMNQRYLALELYRGVRYEEGVSEKYEEKVAGGQFVRDKFTSSRMFFDLSSFDMGDTDESLFRRSRLVQTRAQLITGIDSMQRDIHQKEEQMFSFVANTFTYHYVKDAPIPDQIAVPKAYYDSLRNAERELKESTRDSIDVVPKPEDKKLAVVQNKQTLSSQGEVERPDNLRVAANGLVTKTVPQQFSVVSKGTFEQHMRRFEDYYKGDGTRLSNAMSYGINKSRSARNVLNSRVIALESVKRDQRKFVVTKNQQIARSFACLIMFLIGAPIGAIIKKGGLGLPVIISVVFFLIYYVLNTTGDKWGKEGVMDPALAVWISNVALLPFGLFFLRQARNDAQLFEPDFYLNMMGKIKKLFKKRKELKTA